MSRIYRVARRDEVLITLLRLEITSVTTGIISFVTLSKMSKLCIQYGIQVGWGFYAGAGAPQSEPLKHPDPVLLNEQTVAYHAHPVGIGLVAAAGRSLGTDCKRHCGRNNWECLKATTAGLTTASTISTQGCLF